MGLGLPEIVVIFVLGLTGLAVPIITIALLVLIYRRVSEMRQQLDQLTRQR